MGRVIDRRRVMGSQDVLPYGVVPIEYLESNGVDNIFVNLPIFMREGLDAYVDFMLMGYTNYGYIIGTQESTRDYFIVRQASTTGKYNIGFPGGITLYTSTTQIPLNTILHLHYSTWNKNQFCKVNDTTIASAANEYTGVTRYPICIFSTLNLKGFLRIYKITFFLHSEKILECIPVRVGQVGYMYDKISGQLFGNSGTGDFILGPDK